MDVLNVGFNLPVSGPLYPDPPYYYRAPRSCWASPKRTRPACSDTYPPGSWRSRIPQCASLGLALHSGASAEDLVREVPRHGAGQRTLAVGCGAERGAAAVTEARRRRQIASAARASAREPGAALKAETGIVPILLAARGALHLGVRSIASRDAELQADG